MSTRTLAKYRAPALLGAIGGHQRQHLTPKRVNIVVSGAPCGGIDDPGLPPVAPATANAVFAAIGRWLQRLPPAGALLISVAGQP